jgi:hypothetical protein
VEGLDTAEHKTEVKLLRAYSVAKVPEFVLGSSIKPSHQSLQSCGQRPPLATEKREFEKKGDDERRIIIILISNSNVL